VDNMNFTWHNYSSKNFKMWQRRSKHDLFKMTFGTLVIQIHNFAFQHKNYNHFQKHRMFLCAHERKLVPHTHMHFLLFMKKLQFIPHMFGIYFVPNYMLDMFNLTI
jgi:hypothetical protein